MALETARGFAYIAATLAASPAWIAAVPGGIHQGVAPDQATAVTCVMSLPSPNQDVSVHEGLRLAVEPLYQVKIVGREQDYLAVLAAADLTDSLLQPNRKPSNGTALGLIIAYCVRQTAVDYTTVEAGVIWHHMGGLYRLFITS